MNKEFRKSIILTICVIFVGLMAAGGTYAWLSNSVNVTNGVHNVSMHCFLIDYNINNVSGGQEITGTMFPSENASGGLNGRVGLKTNSSCNVNGEGTLKIHVNSANNALLTNSASYCESRKTMEKIDGITTKAACDTAGGRWRGYGDSYCENPDTLARLTDYTDNTTCNSNGGVWKTGGSPLKYAVYDNASLTGTPLSVGTIVSSDVGNDKIILDGVSITSTQKYYYIYVWLDGYLIDDSVAEFTFNAYISASAIQSLLPSGYQRLMYIESSGTQYINTGVLTKQTLKTYCEYATTTASRTLFGARESTSANSITYGFFDTGPSSYVGFGRATTKYSITSSQLDGTKHSVYLDNTTYQIDGINQTISNRGTLSKYYNIYLGTWNNANSADSRMFVGKIYRFTIWDNSEVIRDLVPCRNGTTVGMCDTVESKFYANARTGSFTAGPDI